MKTYYIYHIPGVKIGCTVNPEHRINQEQGYPDYEILETYEDPQIAGDRELELQAEYGYRVDTQHYVQSTANRHKWGNPEDQKKFSDAVKNRFVWNSETNSKAAKNAWIKDRDKQLDQARSALKKATEVARTSPNRASLIQYECSCGRIITGAGPTGIHKKLTGHETKRLDNK